MCHRPYYFHTWKSPRYGGNRPGAWPPRQGRDDVNKRTRTLPQLLQPVARAVTCTALTVAGFFMLAAPSLLTGPM